MPQGDTLTAEERGRVLDSLLAAFTLNDDDIEQLTQDITDATVTSYRAAYADAADMLAAEYDEEDAEPEDEEDDAEDGADHVAATYHSDLFNQVNNALGLLPPGIGEHEAEQTVASSTAAWAAGRAEWKATQIAQHETATAASDGTSAAVSDVLDGEIVTEADLTSYYVTVIHDGSSADDCADWAGFVFPLDTYFDVPDFPIHYNCVHEKVVLDAQGVDFADIDEAYAAQQEAHALLADALSQLADVSDADVADLGEEDALDAEEVENAAADQEVGDVIPAEFTDASDELDVGDEAPQIDYLHSLLPPETLSANELEAQLYAARANEAEAIDKFQRGIITRRETVDKRIYAREQLEARLARLRGGRGAIIHFPSVLDDPDGVTREILYQHFGRDLSNEEIGALVGAPEGSYIRLGVSGDRDIYSEDYFKEFPDFNPEGLSINFYPPDYPGWKDPETIKLETLAYYGERTVYKTEFGLLYIHNDTLVIRDDLQGSGLGSAIFADEVQHASDLGVDEIHTYAAGRYGDPDWNGYYTWPRLGYDAKITDLYTGELPKEFASSTYLSDLMATREGREWWKLHGVGGNMLFDLDPESDSRRVLATYMSERAKLDKLQALRSPFEPQPFMGVARQAGAPP